MDKTFNLSDYLDASNTVENEMVDNLPQALPVLSQSDLGAISNKISLFEEDWHKGPTQVSITSIVQISKISYHNT